MRSIVSVRPHLAGAKISFDREHIELRWKSDDAGEVHLYVSKVHVDLS